MPFLNPVMDQGPELHTCGIHVVRVDTGLEYEDTIDTFLNADSRNLHKDASQGPSNYDFTIFKRQLMDALSYDHELDMIIYSHAQNGEVEVNHDWKWRVALKYLSSQPDCQGRLSFGIRKKSVHPSIGDRDVTEVSAGPTTPPPMSHMTRQTEIP